MVENIRYSIIIPVLNREDFLPDLFKSILLINYDKYEVVFVDNGSTDNSLQLLEEFACEHNPSPHIQIIRTHHRGACIARNEGLKIANGKYVYFFDSDDLLSPDYFQDVDKLLPADIIACHTTLRFPDGKEHVRDYTTSNNPHSHILSGALSTQSMCIRKHFLEMIGGWNETLQRWNDYELGARILLHRPKIKWLKQKPYHIIRIHDHSITGNSFHKDLPELLKSLNVIHRNILSSDVDSAMKNKCLMALLGKHFILKIQLLKEDSPNSVQSINNAIAMFPLNNIGLKIIYWISAFWTSLRLPGLWRILNIII